MLRFRAIVVKEIYHILRDYRTLLVLFILPVLQLVLLGYAMDTEPHHINLAVNDYDRSVKSRELIDSLSASSLFSVIVTDSSPASLFTERDAEAVLVIQNGYQKELFRNKSLSLSLEIDAADSQRAQSVAGYIEGAVASALGQAKSPIVTHAVYLFNPERKSAYFFVPGITALLILMASALLSSLAITREKESGTFTLLKLSSLGPWHIIGGKLIPYAFLSWLLALVVTASGMLMFGVPMSGNLFFFFVMLFLYTLTGISLGLLISSVAETQQVAMLMSLFITLLPTLLLSGFIFPLDSMPVVLRVIGHVLPATYFLECIRGIMLKANTAYELFRQIVALGIFTFLFLVAGTVRAKKLMELV